MAITMDLNGATAGTTSTVSFTEQTPVLVFPSATFTANGADNNNVDTVTVTLTGATGTESLFLDATGTSTASTNAITVNYNSGTGVLTLTGANETNATWQSLLQHIQYNNTSDSPTGSRSLSVTATNSGGGGNTATISGNTINVTPVDDDPVNTVPGSTQVEDFTVAGDLIFSSGNGNQISVNDVDNTTLTVTLTVSNGTLTLNGTSGLSFTTGDGAGDATMTFSGTTSAINTALNGLAYHTTSTNLQSGNTDDTLTVTTSDGSAPTDSDPINIDVICFMPGTNIAVPDGEAKVETLRAGDRVVTADGSVKKVCWIGRQTVSMKFADPLRVLPIRIREGALSENLPCRDLLISPDHAILVDGVLVQAAALVNGTSIVRESDVPQVYTYYHVELDDHSLVLAENVAAETFIDNVDRLGFDNWAEHEALYPQGKPIEEMIYPRAKSFRQVPQATRNRLVMRGQALYGEVAAAVA